jgi:hypothetical protein
MSVAPQKGLPGRLTKGAGTHLASWLQEVSALNPEEAQALLDNDQPGPTKDRCERAKAGLFQTHGKTAGHAHTITDVAFSGTIMATKDSKSMRLWRAHGDFALLRVLTCRGNHVAFHPSGQFIVTGTRTAAAKSTESLKHLKIWGPAGGSAFSAGKASFLNK